MCETKPTSRDACSRKREHGTLLVTFVLVFMVAIVDLHVARAAGPLVRSVLPAGGQRGTTSKVSFNGDFPNWPAQAWVDSAGLSLAPLAEKGDFNITIAADKRENMPAWPDWLDLQTLKRSNPVRWRNSSIKIFSNDHGLMTGSAWGSANRNAPAFRSFLRNFVSAIRLANGGMSRANSLSGPSTYGSIEGTSEAINGSSSSHSGSKPAHR